MLRFSSVQTLDTFHKARSWSGVRFAMFEKRKMAEWLKWLFSSVSVPRKLLLVVKLYLFNPSSLCCC